jgi:hypothetical protein
MHFLIQICISLLSYIKITKPFWKPPPPKFPSFDKPAFDCKLSGKCLVFHSSILISLKISEFRMPTPQDIQKKGSKILKLQYLGSQLFYISNDK